MKYKVLYIDDEVNSGREQIETIKDALEVTGLLDVEIYQVDELQVIIEKIKKEDFEAVILDLELDSAANSRGEIVTYKAPTLAQNIREQSAEHNKLDIPIILCSTNDKIKKSYKKDLSSHDLFDMRFDKGLRDYHEVTKEISSLIQGYKIINKKHLKFHELLETPEEVIDSRIYSSLLLTESLPAYNIAQLIVKELIFINGPLIPEELLAVRLGIDVEKSAGWNELKEKFSAARYTGVFSSGWNRWWMHKVLSIFREITGKNLVSLDAVEKVELIKSKTGISEIKHPERIEMCQSYNFWTLCKGYHKPLDPREGFKIIMAREPKVWQDYDYISLHAVLEREGFEERGIHPHPSEIKRIELIKETME